MSTQPTEAVYRNTKPFRALGARRGARGRTAFGLPFALLAAVTLLPFLGKSVGVALAEGQNAAGDSSNTSGEMQPTTLQEVVVTAQKRVELVQDVPMSLTAITGAQLLQSHSFRLEDYLGKVPGLAMIDNGANGGQLIIRGLTTGSTGVNATVATYIDETPYTSVGPWVGSANLTPNVDPFDMQRIEVLRGPQGTLYGANALGGLVKYVTNAPDPSAYESKIALGGSTIANGGPGYDAHAMINIPLSQYAALRIVGYSTYYAGFIDDPSRNLTDINGSHISGGRVSLLVSPSDRLSIRFNALYQQNSARNPGEEQVSPGTLKPIYGNLIMEHLIDENSYMKNELYNLTINADLGFAKLLSATSYARVPTSTTTDFSAEYGGYAQLFLGAPYGVADLSRPAQAFNAATQELRLSSAARGPFEWQLGGFFTNQRGEDNESLLPIDITTKKVLFDFPANLATSVLPVTYKEYAAFANFDYHFTQTVDASVGGRYSRNDQTFSQNDDGLFFGGQAPIYSRSTSEDVFTYSGDIRWHVTEKSMLYARIAKGFAPGGPNDVAPTAPAPNSYGPSTTINYEAGLKSNLMDNRLGIDVAAFLINWNAIQVTASVNGLNEFVNGGTARSEGGEWSLSYIPARGLTLNFNGAYTDAYLTEATPASARGRIGDRLPAVPLWGTSAGAEYTWPLFGGYSGVAAVDWRFTGSRYSNFSSQGTRQLMPSYNIVDIRAGLRAARWSAALYVRNIGNKLAINYVNPYTLAGNAGPLAAVVYPPRTIGGEVTVTLQ